MRVRNLDEIQALIVIKDLKEFIEGESDISCQVYAFGQERLSCLKNNRYFSIGGGLFSICGNWVCHGFEPRKIVSIADPKYREKLLEYLRCLKKEAQ